MKLPAGLIGRRIESRIDFIPNGTFKAIDAAQSLLKEQGYTIGSMDLIILRSGATLIPANMLNWMGSLSVMIFGKVE
jgi:hypothetical protein